MAGQSATIYFLSGTGNSYRAACWAKEAAEREGFQTCLVPIEKKKALEEGGEVRPRLIGVTTPTHAFTLPWPLVRFLLSLPRGNGAWAFVIPTRGWFKLGWLVVPGLEGTGGYLAVLILALKGYSVRGMMGLDMPVNWMAVHAALRADKVDFILVKSRKKLADFMGAILAGKRYFTGFIRLVLGLALFQVSLGYMLMGRFFLAKLFFANFRCKGCGRCSRLCPFGSIKLRGARPRPYWTYGCENCMRCMSVCPENAVEVSYLLAIVYVFITTIPVSVVLMKWFTGLFPGLAPFDGRWARRILQYPYFLLSIFLAYLLFNFVIRVPWINKIFTYTTLTHLFRRYFEPGTKPEDVQGR